MPRDALGTWHILMDSLYPTNDRGGEGAAEGRDLPQVTALERQSQGLNLGSEASAPPTPNVLNHSAAKDKCSPPPTSTGRASPCGASLSKGGCKDPAMPESHCPEERAALPGVSPHITLLFE